MKLLTFCWRSFVFSSAVAIALLVLLLGVMLWVQSATRDVSAYAPSILRAVTGEGFAYSIETDAMELSWDSWRNPAVVVADNLRIHDAQGREILRIASAALSLDVLGSVLGEWRVQEVELRDVALAVEKDGEVVRVRQTASTVALWSSGEQSASVPPTFDWPVEAIRLADARVSFMDKATGVTSALMLDQVEISQQEGAVQAQYDARLVLAQREIAFTGKSSLANDSITALVRFDALNLVDFCAVVVQCDALPKLDAPLKGSVAVTLANDFALEDVLVVAEAQQGSLAFAPHLPETLNFEHFALRGKWQQPIKQLSVEHVGFGFGETKLKAHGMARLGETSGGYNIELDADALNMPVNDLYKYWPQGLAPETRTWATTKIREGMATSAYAKIRLKPEDFARAFFPDEFLETGIVVENSTVDYLPGFPKLKQVNGSVAFTGTTMTAKSDSARLLDDTDVTSAQIIFTDLNAAGTPVEVQIAADTSLADAAAIMAKLPANPLQHLPVSPEKLQGKLATEITLAFDAFGNKESKGINWNAVRYNVTGKVSDTAAIAFSEGITVEHLGGDFAVSNDAEKINARAHVSGESVAVKYRHEDDISAVDVKGTLNAALLATRWPDVADYVQGDVRIDAAYRKTRGAQPLIEATLDAVDAMLMLDAMGYRKPLGAAALLSMQTQRDADKPTDRHRWDISMDGLKANGVLRFDAKSGELSAVDVVQLKTSNQDFAARYRSLNDGVRIDVSGDHVDLSHYLAASKKDATSISDFPPVRLNLDVKEIEFLNKQLLRDVKGHVHCHSERCESADLHAMLVDKAEMQLAIFRDDAARKFRLQSSDAAALFKVFDVTDRMNNGVLDISGTYDDNTQGNPLAGRFILTDFTLKDAPILGRILNLGSLPGLVETLSSTGISFDKLSSDIVFVRDVAMLKKVRATGQSLGILGEGSIDVASHIIDFSGNLAPIYMLNSLVSKIPLIGEALVGGKGEGVFAVSFSVKGDPQDPQVSVNPLSALTPGFTRKFFDIFETDAPTEAPQVKK